MSWILILAIVTAWIFLSGFLLISVCMMSSLANQQPCKPEKQSKENAADIATGEKING